METNQAGIDLIEKWEGFYPNAYDDGEGVWTVGFGTIRWDMKTPVKKGDTISRAEAERQLRKECQRVEDAIDKAIKVPLNPNQHGCLVSWGYNVGSGWITGEGHAQATFIKQLNKGNYEAVPAGLLKFTRGANTGKSYQGLLNRRKDEARLWLTPADEPTKPADTAASTPDEAKVPPMPQAVTSTHIPTSTTLATSKTVRYSGGGIIATLVSAWSWLFGVAKDAGTQAVSEQQTLTPFSALFKVLGANMELIALIVVLGCLAGVIFERLAKERA